MRDFPLRAWIYTAVVAVCAGLAVLGLAHGEPHLRLDLALAFGLLFLIAELAPISFPNASYSVSFIIVVAALAAVGPAEAAIAAAFGALDLSVRDRPDWLGRMVFNGSQLVLATACAGAVYRATGGPAGVDATRFPWILVPLFAAALVYFVANTSAVAGLVSLVRRVSFLDVWAMNFLSVAGSTLAFALIGVLIAAMYRELGLFSVLVVIAPLVVARRALQAAVTMEHAYEDVLKALVQAIEVKDKYTRGHAERVSRLAGMIAKQLGFGERRARALRVAALMHDLGKLVVSTDILTKPGKLTPEEYEHMKTHPVHGVHIAEGIDFLREFGALDAVRHHHERMDGRGYPDGLGGDDIPLTARIVMVADAFDSMTSTRSYRLARPVEPAIGELRRCAGNQFDEAVIDALETAIAVHGWEPSPEAYEGEQAERPATDVHAEAAAR
jgi:HD superfamily phosphohydrolase YqeK